MKTASFFLLFFLSNIVFLQAEVIKHVIDGDTVILENEQRVRLIGIDTPEVDHPKYNRQGEYFGEEAKAYLRSRVLNKEVRIESDHEAYDKYGRRLGYLFLGEILLNRELIVEGYAEATRRFSYRYKDEFLRLEEEARSLGKGMWARDNQVSLFDKLPRFSMGVAVMAFVLFPFIYRFLNRKFKLRRH